MTEHADMRGKKARILMVDDHPIVREGMGQFLNLQPDLELSAEAENADQALACVNARQPDLVIVDITLQGDSGLELVRTLRHRYPQLPTLVMSMHDELLFAERALRAGASGYLMKLEATEQILQAIRSVLAGEIYLSPSMHNGLAMRLVDSKRKLVGPVANLSDREFEVLHLIGLGFGTRQIAEKLNRSVKTIEAHRAHLKEKLLLTSGKELDRFALQWQQYD